MDQNLRPLGAAFLLLMIGLILSLPRPKAFLPLLATVCYIPLGQQVVFAGLHFTILRLVILAGAFRVWYRSEYKDVVWNDLDRLLFWWASLGFITGTLTELTMENLINRCGAVYNSVGIYLLAACWVRDARSFLGLLRTFALLVFPLAVLMIAEKLTSRNIFSIFGGVPEFTVAREGSLRCQAAFRHPILAGTFGATAFPLFAGMLVQSRKEKWLGLLGCASCCVIALTASSGGALSTLIMGWIAFGFWRFRFKMRAVRRSIVVLILILAIVMKAPVWYLFARASSIVGGTGWHRAWLIDATIANFKDWWLLGTNETAHWGSASQVVPDDPRNIDITNQFVLEGVRGGLVKLVLHVALIVKAFQFVGLRVRSMAPRSLAAGFFFWSVGVSLFTHCMSFTSVTYFDQMAVIWFWLLASIARIAGSRTRSVGCPAQNDAGVALPYPGHSVAG